MPEEKTYFVVEKFGRPPYFAPYAKVENQWFIVCAGRDEIGKALASMEWKKEIDPGEYRVVKIVERREVVNAGS